MKLYFHPASTTCRPIMLFAAEAGIPLEMQVVDLFTGEQYTPAYQAINPNSMVPLLEDGSFRLSESSSILKYLAEKTGNPAYPSDLQKRARVNESMDWTNTQLNRDLCYGFIYPQIFGTHKRRSDEAHEAQLEWGKSRAQGWLKMLDANTLSGGQWLCGDTITIADYFCAPFVHVAQLTGTDFAEYPNLRAWLGRMKALPSWGKVFETIEGYGASLKGQPLVPV
jgi:glutathione S-transferase